MKLRWTTLILAFTALSATGTGDYQFVGDATVKKLELPADCTAIGEGAYAGSSITEAVIPDGVTEIGAWAFARCTELKSVVVPESVRSIPQGAFLGCTSLVSITLPSSLISIGDYALACTAVESLDLSHCSAVTSLGTGALAQCSALKEIKLPPHLKIIDDISLLGCGSLSSLTIPSSVEEIGDWSMTMMTNVTALSLPSSLTRIGTNAMERMDRLSMLDGSTMKCVPELGDDVWHGLDQSLIRLSVDPWLVNDFSTTPQWKEFDIKGQASMEINEDFLPANVTETIIYNPQGIKVDNSTQGVRIEVKRFSDGTCTVKKEIQR